MGWSYRLGRWAFKSVKGAFLTAYTKPLFALVALGWAFLAAWQTNHPFVWEYFRYYAIGQAAWLLYYAYLRLRFGEGSLVTLFLDSFSEPNSFITKITGALRSIFAMLSLTLLPLGLLVFTVLNFYFLFLGVFSLFFPVPSASFLSQTALFLLGILLVRSYWAYRSRYKAMAKKKVQRMGGWLGEILSQDDKVLNSVLSKEELESLEE